MTSSVSSVCMYTPCGAGLPSVRTAVMRALIRPKPVLCASTIWPSMQYSRSAAVRRARLYQPGRSTRQYPIHSRTGRGCPPRTSVNKAFIELRDPMPPSLPPSERWLLRVLPWRFALPAEAAWLPAAVPDDEPGMKESKTSSTACVCSGMSGESETMSSYSRALPARRLDGAAASARAQFKHAQQGRRAE